ncbi:ATPase, T2SS/T4P/T4SS family [Ferroacidibacillus organovorans]|nr:ATPase, T2SS/T4P/T4SS family [Ferroacidibacillus organovorans]
MKLRKKRDLTFYRIVPPHDFKSYSPNYAHVFMQFLAALGLPRRLEWLQGPLPFRFIVTKAANEATVTLYLGVPSHRTLGVQSAFHSAYPNLHLIESPSPVADLALDGTTLVTHFKMGGRGARRWLPLAGVDSDGGDPLDALITAMVKGTAQDQCILDIWMAPVRDVRFRRMIHGAEQSIRKPAHESFFSPSEIFRAMTTNDSDWKSKPVQQKPLSEESQRMVQTIHMRLNPSYRPFQVSVRLYVRGHSSKERLGAMLMAMQQTKGSGRMALAFGRKKTLVQAIQTGRPTRRMWWTSPELAALVHVPQSHQPSFPFITGSPSLILPPPARTSGIRVGWSDFPGREGEEIRIPLRQMAKHAFVAGTTGSGKTTTLLQTLLGIVDQMQKEPTRHPVSLFSIRMAVPSRSCCRTFHPHSTQRCTLFRLARPSTRAA